MRRKRRKPPTVAEARAMQNPADLEAIAKSHASQMDIVEPTIHCVVCGAPAKTAILRIHLPELAGAKIICSECEATGWAWMSNMAEGEGSIEETKAISTVEENAHVDGDSNEVARTLFESTTKMQNSRQNPMSSYKEIRRFEDDTLILHLRECKDHSGGPEGHLWEIYADKNQIFTL